MKIHNMKPGDKAKVIGYAEEESDYFERLLSLGLTKGETLELKVMAPLGDPVELVVRGFNLSLRKHEADSLLLEKV